MEYENPLNSIQFQAAKFRGLMQRKPEERPVVEYKRISSEKRNESTKKTKQNLKSSVEVSTMLERDTTVDIAEKKLNNYREFLNFVQLNY